MTYRRDGYPAPDARLSDLPKVPTGPGPGQPHSLTTPVHLEEDPMPEEPFADLSDQDHVQRMIFTLPVNAQLLTGWSTPLERSRFLEELFTDYLADVVPYRHYIVRWPTPAERPAQFIPGFDIWQVEIAVIRRPDEDK